jgi:hypothetical protein
MIQTRRREDGEGDTAHRLPARDSGNPRRFLERGVHHAECRDENQKQTGETAYAFEKNHAAHGIDI